MERSETIAKLAKALINAQGQIKKAEKSSDNPFFHSKYADLEACWEAIKQPLQDNGLAVTQLVGEFDTSGCQGVTTMLLHESGEFISQYSSIPISKKDPHGAGSGITYLRRYGVSAIIGLIQADDDGNKAVKNVKLKALAKEPPVGKAEYDALSEEMQVAANRSVAQIKEAWATGDPEIKRGSYMSNIHGIDSDMKMAIWYLLQPHSAIRRALKQLQVVIDEETKEEK